MFILASTSAKLTVTSSAAVTVDAHESHVDVAGTPQVAAAGSDNLAISTATTQDLVASPAASTIRNVKTLNFRNKHASSPNDITVNHTDGTTTAELYKATLLAGDNLYWGDRTGWIHTNSSGEKKVSGPITGPMTVKALAADQSNSTTTPTEVVGLKVPLPVGVYTVVYSLIYQAAVNTTGVRFSVNFDGTVTRFAFNSRNVTALATAADANPDQDVVTATMGVMQAFAARAKSVAGWGTTLGVDTANVDMLLIIEGQMVVTVAGELELWHGSEVAAASTVMAGSMVTVTKAP